ncbi:MAG TPA: GspH/FimT family pseudopilin [Nitrospira sp.]|nr:GspH/FimT family pseudopilin [Nitrospira sp.]
MTRPERCRAEINDWEKGLTLCEVITALTITAILVAIAVPTYRALILRTQARSVAVEVASQLRMARQLAMARRERLAIRFDQAEQRVVFIRTETGEILEQYGYAEKSVAIPEPTGGPEVLFHPSGRSATATTIVIVDKDGKSTKLTVSLTGRVTIS